MIERLDDIQATIGRGRGDRLLMLANAGLANTSHELRAPGDTPLLPGWRGSCFEPASMRTEAIMSRALFRVRAHNYDAGSIPVERSRRVALVIAESSLAAFVAERYRARGYEVHVSETPLDAIHRLVWLDHVDVVVVSPEVPWASGLRELMEDEFPEIHRILLVA